MKSIEQLLQQHPFFHGLPAADRQLISGCGENCVYSSGEYIARENTPADFFFVIREGRVAVETYMPSHGALCLQTLHDGDIFGWSWLFPPYRWTFDARALEKVRAIRLDGKCLRQKCEEDPRLGFELMKRFAKIVAERLQATRLQLLDVYSTERPPPAEVR